jgi:hypothetical protein
MFLSHKLPPDWIPSRIVVFGAFYVTLDTLPFINIRDHLWYVLAKADVRAAVLCTFRIPNAEITTQWHQWLKDHLRKIVQPSFLDMRDIITHGEADKLQLRLTAFTRAPLIVLRRATMKRFIERCATCSFSCCSTIAVMKSKWAMGDLASRHTHR